MSKIILTWPESQDLLGCKDYRKHSKLINGDRGLEEYGSCAYIVDEDWWEGDLEPNDEEENDEDLEICYDEELEALGFLDEWEDDEEDFEEE